jgi:hypothetical protein
VSELNLVVYEDLQRFLRAQNVVAAWWWWWCEVETHWRVDVSVGLTWRSPWRSAWRGAQPKHLNTKVMPASTCNNSTNMNPLELAIGAMEIQGEREQL